MIIYRKGDVIKALADGEISLLAHGCNCSGGFGSGVAGGIVKRYPSVRNAYLRAHEAGHWKLGAIQIIVIGSNRAVINCGTQQEFGGSPEEQPLKMYCSYDAIKEVMLKLYTRVSSERTLGIPMIAAGLAGGNWKVIEAIINEVFHDKDIYVYTWEG